MFMFHAALITLAPLNMICCCIPCSQFGNAFTILDCHGAVSTAITFK
jgi:hypothetical protein